METRFKGLNLGTVKPISSLQPSAFMPNIARQCLTMLCFFAPWLFTKVDDDEDMKTTIKIDEGYTVRVSPKATGRKALLVIERGNDKGTGFRLSISARDCENLLSKSREAKRNGLFEWDWLSEVYVQCHPDGRIGALGAKSVRAIVSLLRSHKVNA